MIKHKNETLKLLDTMIENADKGPSGFWTEDFEGCDNPKIFPEFEEGLKGGRLIQKPHYLCPWNTAILFGNGRGNIITGCYHSCSIDDAKYLSEDMLKSVLVRFKENMQAGRYDDKTNIRPLLTATECEYIEQQKILERNANEQKRKAQQAEVRIKAASLVKKYADSDVLGVILSNYETNTVAMTYEGTIDFSTNSLKEVVGGEKLTYNDYIDIQIQSFGKQRSYFKSCHYNYTMGFKGQIEKITKDTICFERIFVSGMYPDSTMFDGKEEHVWMKKDGFEDYSIGDCLEFFAEVYPYLKTGKGKLIDYGLRNPQGIKKISDYDLPTEKDLIMQEVDQIICETCYLTEHCNRVFCMRPQKEMKELRNQMFRMIQNK